MSDLYIEIAEAAGIDPCDESHFAALANAAQQAYEENPGADRESLVEAAAKIVRAA